MNGEGELSGRAEAREARPRRRDGGVSIVADGWVGGIGGLVGEEDGDERGERDWRMMRGDI